MQMRIVLNPMAKLEWFTNNHSVEFAAHVTTREETIEPLALMCHIFFMFTFGVGQTRKTISGVIGVLF